MLISVEVRLFRTATGFQLADFMGTFRGVDDFVQENERGLPCQKT